MRQKAIGRSCLAVFAVVVSWTLLAGCSAAGLFRAPLKPVAGKKVLLVHSYDPEYPWVRAINDGVRKVLKDTGVELDIFYMDTKRRTAETWKVQAGARATAKVAEYKPDVVIAADDNAQQYFGRHHVGTWLALVFCGVNADPAKYGYPAPNVTGIIERPHFKATLEYVSQFRRLKNIAVLGSDDPTSSAIVEFMKKEPVDVDVVEFRLVRDFRAWKRAVRRYNRTVYAVGICGYHTLTDRPGGQRVDPKAVMEWTSRHATVPTFVFFDFGVKEGVLAGVVESGSEHGEKAAGYALQILRGAKPGSLPIVKASVGRRMVNRETAERLGLVLTDAVLKDAIVVPAGDSRSEKQPGHQDAEARRDLLHDQLWRLHRGDEISLAPRPE